MAAKKKKKAAAKKPAKKQTAKKPAKKAATAKKKAAPKKAAKKSAKKKSAAPKKKSAAPKKQSAAPKKKSAPVAAPVESAPVESAVAERIESDGGAAEAKPAGPVDVSIEIAQAVAALAIDKKAEDVIILKVTDLTSYADCFILASAPSERQVQAIARHVGDEMKQAGKAPVGTEGLEQGHWVLVDLGAVVLHVFLSSARRYYDLEGFWSDAPRIEPDEKHGVDVLNDMRARHSAETAGGDDDDDSHFAAANE